MEKTRKLNCWEFKTCGREKGGLMAEVYGECPVPTAMRFDGLNEGIGGGRACWMVPKAACTSDPGCRSRQKSCCQCDFYRRVVHEQEKQTHFKFASTTS